MQELDFEIILNEDYEVITPCEQLTGSKVVIHSYEVQRHLLNAVQLFHCQLRSDHATHNEVKRSLAQFRELEEALQLKLPHVFLYPLLEGKNYDEQLTFLQKFIDQLFRSNDIVFLLSQCRFFSEKFDPDTFRKDETIEMGKRLLSNSLLSRVYSTLARRRTQPVELAGTVLKLAEIRAEYQKMKRLLSNKIQFIDSLRLFSFDKDFLYMSAAVCERVEALGRKADNAAQVKHEAQQLLSIISLEIEFELRSFDKFQRLEDEVLQLKQKIEECKSKDQQEKLRERKALRYNLALQFQHQFLAKATQRKKYLCFYFDEELAVINSLLKAKWGMGV